MYKCTVRNKCNIHIYIQRVSWTERKTNEEVLKTVGEERRLVKTIVERKKKWIGHILRGKGLMKDVLEGRMEGKRPRGRKRMGMIDELKEGSYGIMKRRAENRTEWRAWVPKTCRQAEH